MTDEAHDLWRQLRPFVEPIGKFAVGRSEYEDTQNALVIITRFLASRPSAIVEEPKPTGWHDVDYLMSIIDSAIEDGFDPDEDGPLLDEIRAELKAIPPSPHPHTGRAGVTEETRDLVAAGNNLADCARSIVGASSDDPDAAEAFDMYFAARDKWRINARAALNAALTVEPEAGEVTVKPLEWEEVTSPREDGPHEPTGDWSGFGVTGAYCVYFFEDHFEVTRPDGEYVERHLADPDEAKAAAQADYTARIRSAIAP